MNNDHTTIIREIDTETINTLPTLKVYTRNVIYTYFKSNLYYIVFYIIKIS